ncbi:MAG TPA: penicillin-binding protein 2 [Phycisphaerae bacterium]|nr:penicillin-binding protein 2 [Phycisphaerae bacterium]
MADPKTGAWRHNVVFGVLALCAVGLCVRLAWLVRCNHGAAARAQRQQRMVIPLPGRPGSIFARTRSSYVPIALSRQVPSCYLDPFLLRDEEIAEVSLAVGQALSRDPVRQQERIIRRRGKRFLWVQRGVTPQQVEAVRKIRNPAVGLLHEWRREYPSGSLGATVVGFRRHDGAGGGGLELSLDRYLRAADGRRVILADAFRRPIWPVTGQSRPPRDGCSVFLCLDAVIQGVLETAVSESVREFDAKWGTGVVVDPQTGDVLAMCSAPSFDPAQYHRASAANRTNRAICTPYEPGSVLKPIYAAAAVDAGLVTYQTQIFCENGTYHAPRGGRISDHGSHYGHLTVEDVVVHSSSIGMAKIGEKLGNKAQFAVAYRFGFGARSGVGLPGESPGIIRPLRKWDGYSLRRVPFGQEISVTALQLAMAFSSLANGGLLMQPRLVDHVRGADGKVVWRSRPTVVRRTLKPSVAARSLAVLEQVVERGTGKRCRLTHWTSFGKTGTAEIAGRGGYVSGAYVGTFAGGAPVSGPRVLCLISIYWPDRAKGYYGAKVAAPYVQRVLTRTLTYLNVPPDKPGVDAPDAGAYAAARNR